MEGVYIYHIRSDLGLNLPLNINIKFFYISSTLYILQRTDFDIKLGNINVLVIIYVLLSE